MQSKGQKVQKEQVLLRLDVDLLGAIKSQSLKETVGRGCPVSVQKLIVEQLERLYQPKGTKRNG